MKSEKSVFVLFPPNGYLNHSYWVNWDFFEWRNAWHEKEYFIKNHFYSALILLAVLTDGMILLSSFALLIFPFIKLIREKLK